MSPEPVTADRIYRRLKLDITSGRFRPGSLVNSQLISKEYGTSITPVRDAMQRLVGERLLEHHDGGGFEVPALSPVQLRDLYEWHGQLIRLAIGHHSKPIADSGLLARLEHLDVDNGLGLVQGTAEVFHRIAANSDNAEHLIAIDAIGDRLFAMRLREHPLRHRKAELIAVWSAVSSGRASTARNAIWAYHRRRVRRADFILKHDPQL